MQVPVGILSDSWGAKKTIILFSLIASFGAICFGFSPDFTMAIVSRGLVGFGLSATFIAVMCILVKWFRPAELARVSGLLMAIGGAGWFLATTPLALLSQKLWLEGIHRFSRCRVAPHCVVHLVDGRRCTRNKKDSGHIDGKADGPVTTKRNTIEDLKIIFENKSFWAISIWFIMRGGALFGFFGLWAGPYLIDVYKLSGSAAGSILSMVAFAIISISPAHGPHFR